MTSTLTRSHDAAFAQRVERQGRELQLQCYRMVGSLDDARELARAAQMAAWDRRAQAPEALRPWLLEIALERCLAFLAARPERGQALAPAPNAAHLPWLEPYPDHLIDELAWTGEAPPVTLAHVVALQHLPPRERAAAIAAGAPGARPVDGPEERVVLRRYMAAVEHGDPAAIAALLREDARFTMPQEPLCLDGRDAVAAALTEAVAGDVRGVATWANRQPALAVYARDGGEHVPLSLDVLRVEDGRIAEITAFAPEPFAAFGLPPAL